MEGSSLLDKHQSRMPLLFGGFLRNKQQATLAITLWKRGVSKSCRKQLQAHIEVNQAHLAKAALQREFASKFHNAFCLNHQHNGH